MAQQVINVGAAPNDGLGDPIRTAYQKCNTNFSELYSRVQTAPPATLVGTVGDSPGMYAYDSNYFYYCYADYTGNTTVWGKVADSVSDYGNANVVILLASYGSNVISTTGNITGGNIKTANTLINTAVSTTGNVTGGNIITVGIMSSTGNAVHGNISTAGLASVTGNMQAGNLRTAGLVSATGNVNGGNIVSAALVQGVTVSATGNVQAGNLRTAGLVSATGTLAAGNTTVTGFVSATGNITGANLITTANAIIGTDLYVGSGANATAFTNPVIVARDTGLTYIQAALVNTSGNGSADFVAYGNNGDDTQSWMDLGFTGNTFNDANYTITKAGDGYLFAQGNASFGGNLVIATGNTGTTKDIIFATGGFLSGNIKARLSNATGAFSVTGNVIGNNVSSTTTMQLAVYANTTVRDSSIASPIPGMMIYVTGTGMQVRGATAWNTVAGTGT